MRNTFKESFVPILGVLALLFLLLLYVSYQVGLEAEAVTVITIQAPLDGDMDGDLPEQEITSFGAPDKALDEVALLISERQWPQAETRLQKLVEQRDDSRTVAMQGLLRYKQQRYDDALNLLNRAAEKTPAWSGLYFYRALVNSQLTNLPAAESDYRQLLKINPNHFEAHYNLGLLLLRQKKPAEAVTILHRATTLGGGARRARAHYQLGRAWLMQGATHHAEARQNFNLAIRHLPAFIAPRLALVELEPDTTEGKAAAQEQLQTILELSAGNPSALFALAQLEARKGNRKGAISHYRELLQYAPQHNAGRYNLGLLLLKEKEWQQARQQFDGVIENDADNVTALFNRGRAAYRLKDYPAALADYQQAMALKQGHYPEAQLNIGLVYSALKDYPGAEKSYREAIVQRDEYASAWYNLGLLYMRQQRSDEALDALNHAVTLQNNYVQAWYNLGLLYARLEQNDKAIAAYEMALKFRPDYASARLNLAVRWMRKGQPEKAIEHYRQALARDATYSSAWYNMALAYMELKQYIEVDDALKNMLALEPDSVKARRLRARALMSRTQYAEAVVELQQAVDIKADSTTLRLLLAQALRAAGDVQGARRELYKGLALNPEDTSLRDELASLEVLLNNQSGDK